MNSFSQQVKTSDWVTIAGPSGLTELSLPDLVVWADTLKDRIGAILLSEQVQDRLAMSVITLTSAVLEHGIDVIPELTTRDRNRIALTSDLLGLRAIGVTTLLLNQGDLPAVKLPTANHVPVNPVFETDTAGLVSIAENLDLDLAQRESDWLIGTSFEPIEPPDDWTADELTGLSGKGASLLLLKPFHDIERIRRFFGKLVETRQTWNFTILPSLQLFETVEQVRQWRSTPAGQRDSNEWLDRLESSADPLRECLSTYSEWIRELRNTPGVDGLNLVGCSDPDPVLELL